MMFSRPGNPLHNDGGKGTKYNTFTAVNTAMKITSVLSFHIRLSLFKAINDQPMKPKEARYNGSFGATTS
jgi:hypothetical protein